MSTPFLIDLHVHTTASDGIYPPAELVQRASKENIKYLAIADHDNTDGVGEALEAAAGTECEVFPTIEFSVQYRRPGTFHLLGMFIDHTNEDLVSECRRLSALRDTRVVRMVDDLNAKGVDITLEEVEDQCKGGAIGRPHVARALVKKKFARDTSDAFQHFLVKGKPGYVGKERITLEKAVSLIQGAGGVPVIAHPASLEMEISDLEINLKKYREMGILGIEAYAGMHSLEESEVYGRLGLGADMFLTGGSDFHGDKNEVLGHFNHDYPIPVDIIDDILKYKQ